MFNKVYKKTLKQMFSADKEMADAAARSIIHNGESFYDFNQRMKPHSPTEEVPQETAEVSKKPTGEQPWD